MSYCFNYKNKQKPACLPFDSHLAKVFLPLPLLLNSKPNPPFWHCSIKEEECSYMIEELYDTLAQNVAIKEGWVQTVDLGNCRLENDKCCICGSSQAVIVNLAKKLCRLRIQICRLWKCCLKCCRSTLGHIHNTKKEDNKQSKDTCW